MKRVRLLALLLACLAVLGLGGAAFWSLGAVASEAVPQIRVETVNGPVEVRPSGTGDWQTVEVSREIHLGDDVRTGAEGKANIRWGDRGVTRLDPGTMLTVEEAPADAGQVTKVAVRLRLQSGRVWSRVLKLLDVESGFEVRTDAVVATVRGTSFGTAATPSGAELAVTESVIAAIPSSGESETLLKDNQWGSFSATGTPIIVRSLLPTDEWANENRALDREFDDALRNEIEERLRKLGSGGPEWLVALSQDVHYALASEDERQALALERLRNDIASGILHHTSLIPLNHLAWWDKLDGAYRDRAIADARYVLFLGLRRPDLIDESMKDDLRALIRTLADAPDQTYLEGVFIDDAIDAFLLDPQPASGERDALLGRIDAWVSAFPSNLDPDALDALGAKAEAMRRRLDLPAENVVLTSDDSAATSTVSAPEAPSPTAGNPSASPKPPAEQTPPPTTATQPCAHSSFTLFAQPASVTVGTPVKLSLYGSCFDGTTENLTSKASFAPASSADGSVSGNVFTPSRGGSVTLTGTVYENGTPKSAKTTITVTAEKTSGLLRVDASTPGTTSLTTGQSAPLQAKAFYADGSTPDVTYQCVWSSSDPRLATVSNQRIYANAGQGTVTATCTYTDGGKTVSGGVTFTISYDPALTPTSGGTKPNGVSTFLY